ncbi:PC-esterase domain-containing protein 1A-like isoform X2 [Dermacentor albipictus]|uniref:PC-esterase domain-containing protein 1A-like isoform X2 n=1 Tax=Dermacentor albipictus TaxID=60249 RepID=UPI0031FC815C
MPVVFKSEDVRSLLKGKRIVLMGCSNVRAIYKDLVCLYQHNQFVSNEKLKLKMEESSFGDILVCHGKKYNGRGYKEERLFKMDKTTIAFYFLTRVYNDYVKAILEGMVDEFVPDVIIVGSCLWDITRWGPNGVEEYKTNLAVLFTELKRILPPNSLVIWLTAAPLAQDVRGGFLIPQLEFLKYSLRFHVLEANSFCRETADKFGIDVVDVHYHLRMLLEHRAEDGIHWLPLAVRLCTNLVLTHIALSWGLKLPEGGQFITDKERKLMLAEKNGFDYATDEDSKGECSSFPAELSFSTILGCDEEVRNEVIKNAIEVPPSERRKARRGNWRARQFSGLCPFPVARQNETWQGPWQPGFQHQGPGPWNNQGQPEPDS